MSRPNTQFMISPGDGNEPQSSRGSMDAPPYPPSVAGRKLNRTILMLSERCEVYRARIARKRKRRESIGGDQSDLIRTRTAQLLAEIRSGKRRSHKKE